MGFAFTIPTIQEVIEYITPRCLHWPKSFIEWYADKFWNHYQACGWRLSSNVAMKDWRAAFNSNWKELKYFEHRQKLAELIKQEAIIHKTETMTIPTGRMIDENHTINYIDDLLNDFKEGRINREAMGEVYKWMKGKRITRFTPDEKERLISDAGNDKAYGRYLACKLFFVKLIKSGQSFKSYYELLINKTINV